MKGILAAGIAPAICKAEWLMPVNSRILQPNWIEHAWITTPSVVLYDKTGGVIAAKPISMGAASDGVIRHSGPLTFDDLPTCEIYNAKVIVPGLAESDIYFLGYQNGPCQHVTAGDIVTIYTN